MDQREGALAVPIEARRVIGNDIMEDAAALRGLCACRAGCADADRDARHHGTHCFHSDDRQSFTSSV